MTQKSYIATKPMTYATRHLVPGDAFEAPQKHGDLLVAIRKARPASPAETREPGNLQPPPARVVAKAQAQTKHSPPAPPPAAEDLTALRAEYLQALGKKPFNGWDAAELRRRITEAAQS